MSELSFIDGGTIFSDDEKRQFLEERNKINNASKTYVNDDALEKLTDQKFYFDIEKKKIIDDLNRLCKMTVQEFTFYKKYEEIQLLNNFIESWDNQVKFQIWSPKNINDEEQTIKEITELQPKMVLVRTDYNERLWTTLRYYCSTAEYNQAPGRFLKFLMIDDNTGKILGISSIASDVIAISDRDKFIGWTKEDKLEYKMLKYSAIGTTIVPTQPFGSNFLGGKLQACMVTSGVVRNSWENQNYGEANKCKLVGMTTTSLYGRPSMYDGLKWWMGVGLSKGKIPVKSSEKIYKNWHDYLKQHKKDDYEKAMTQKKDVAGPVTGAKMRVLAMIFDLIGVKQSDFQHGYCRGVYWSEFYENSRDFLCRRITEDKLVMKPLFKGDVEEILKWWKPKAISRYLKLKRENRLNPKKLFYNDMIGMSYEEAKSKFFDDVGK